MSDRPILYSFRRCPYAMRARLAVHASKNEVELREVVLRDKPTSMIEISPKGTVPVLLQPDGSVLEESLDIITWSLENAKAQSEAADWAEHLDSHRDAIEALIAQNDGPFKAMLDAYKYPEKHPEYAPETSRSKGGQFISKLDAMLGEGAYQFGNNFSVADAAILPFVRQFAHVDQEWFYEQKWSNVIVWLDKFKSSDRFAGIMPKFKKWEPEDPVVIFGG